MRRYHRAHSGTARVRTFPGEPCAGETGAELYSGAPGSRWLLVRPMGRELHLWHMAGVARTARVEPGHEPTVAAQGARMAGKRPARGRRLGRTLQHLRRPGLQGTRAEHGLANRVGRHGLVRV